MPTTVAKYSALGTPVNLTVTPINSLANGSTSTGMDFDNSTNRDLYAQVYVVLFTMTPTGSPPSLILRAYCYDYTGSGTLEDLSGYPSSAQDSYTLNLTTSTGLHKVQAPMVRLYPFKMAFTITNNSGVTLPGFANAITVVPYNEQIA